MDAPVLAALVPMMPVTDMNRSMAFFQTLGFAIGNSYSDEDGLNWAWLHCGSAQLMLNRAASPIQASHTSSTLWLYCDDLEGTHARLAKEGLEVGEISYPFYNPRGEFHVHDPDGYAVFFAHTN